MVRKDFNWKLCKIRFLYEGTGGGSAGRCYQFRST